MILVGEREVAYFISGWGFKNKIQILSPDIVCKIPLLVRATIGYLVYKSGYYVLELSKQ